MTNDTAKDMSPDGLERVFAEARAEVPSADLMARVLQDAHAEQARQMAAVAPAEPRLPPAPGFWATLANSIGGWGGVTGITAAGVFGVAIGFWAPDAIDYYGAGALGSLTGDTGWTPDLGALFVENGDV